MTEQQGDATLGDGDVAIATAHPDDGVLLRHGVVGDFRRRSQVAVAVREDGHQADGRPQWSTVGVEAAGPHLNISPGGVVGPDGEELVAVGVVGDGVLAADDTVAIAGNLYRFALDRRCRRSRCGRRGHDRGNDHGQQPDDRSDGPRSHSSSSACTSLRHFASTSRVAGAAGRRTSQCTVRERGNSSVTAPRDAGEPGVRNRCPAGRGGGGELDGPFVGDPYDGDHSRGGAVRSFKADPPSRRRTVEGEVRPGRRWEQGS